MSFQESFRKMSEDGVVNKSTKMLNGKSKASPKLGNVGTHGPLGRRH